MDLKECAGYLRERDNFILITHRRPDGDTLGSAAGLCHALNRLGKTAWLFPNPDITALFMPYVEKYKVKSALSAINWKLRERNKRMVLITPGRICTSSPELGVPSAFADISEFDVIVEVSEKRAGYMPELSYGSHIFQDLVEAGILYSAVFEAESTLQFAPELLTEGENALPSYIDFAEELDQIVFVCEEKPGEINLYYDMATEHLLVTRKGTGGNA